MLDVMGGRCCCADGGAQDDIKIAAVGRQSKLRMGRYQNSDELPNVGCVFGGEKGELEGESET